MTDSVTDSVTECVQMAYDYGGNIRGPATASVRFVLHDAEPSAEPETGRVYAKFAGIPKPDPFTIDVYGKPIKRRPPYATLDGLPVEEYNNIVPAVIVRWLSCADTDYDDA